MGKAILRDVASIAAASVMIHIDRKASMKPLPGLNAALTSSIGGILDGSVGSDRLASSEEGRDVVEIFSLSDEAESPT